MNTVQTRAAENQTSDTAERSALTEEQIQRIERIIEDKNRELVQAVVGQKPLLSIKEVAKTFGVSKRTAESIVNAGKLKPIWIKGQRRFHPDAVDAYLRTQSRR